MFIINFNNLLDANYNKNNILYDCEIIDKSQ